MLICPLIALPQSGEATGGNDSIPSAQDARDWKKLLFSGTLDLKDTTVHYPKFLKFCVDVYNWGDKAFNSYDEDYVEGTGKKWKVLLKSDNWLDSYAMNFQHRMPIMMSSNVTFNAGITVSFMALSASYMLDFSNIIGNKPSLQKKIDLGFTCARFQADAYYYENTGGTTIVKFERYNEGKFSNLPFPGLTFRSFGLDCYYFFNNMKYSQGAVYNFSKFQKKSSGSVILGFTISNHKINVDFNSLPEELESYYDLDSRKYKFHYNDYCLLIGYGYNVVFNRHLIFNATAIPGIGIKHAFSDCVQGRQNLFSLNPKGRLGLTYNSGDFFTGLHVKFDGHWFRDNTYSFLNSVENVALIGGVRF